MKYITPSLFNKIINTLNSIYKDSMYHGNLDLYRYKDFLDSLSESQYESKIWACEYLTQLTSEKHDECIVLGGWYGLFSFLFRKEGFDKRITNFDIDPACKIIGEKFKYDNDIVFETMDGLTIFDQKKYNNEYKIFVCTACEHLDQEDLVDLLKKKDRGMLVCLQSNNYYEVNSHINCKDTLEDFVDSLPLKRILYKGEKPYKNEYNRFMVIGK